jgi:hypothetical protein
MAVLELVVSGLEPSQDFRVSRLLLSGHLLRFLRPSVVNELEASPLIFFAAARRAAATYGQNPLPRCAGPPTPRPTQRCQLAAARSWRRELLLLVYNKLSP